jgi:hypothetical protein
MGTVAPGFALRLNPGYAVRTTGDGLHHAPTEHLMTRILRMAVACTAAVALVAAAQSAPAIAPILAADVTTLTARVEAIDYASRVVAVKGPLGRTVALKVDDRVRNLGKVKAGDEIVLTYAEALSVTLAPAGAARSATVTTPAPATAPAGAGPGAALAQQTKIVARVEQVDPARQVVLLEGPKARYAEVKVKDAGAFRGLKVGDSVDVAYTEAVVVDVVTPKK